MTKYTDIFDENAKASHTFSTKNICEFHIFTFKILMKHYLTMSFVLNNWAQVVTELDYDPFGQKD